MIVHRLGKDEVCVAGVGGGKDLTARERVPHAKWRAMNEPQRHRKKRMRRHPTRAPKTKPGGHAATR